tara:strand:+ start:3442 stop:5334 length:1893 start_codon:yes stop_codon:yes gene_type:complete
MNENSKKPVFEQALESSSSGVSDEKKVIESPSTSTLNKLPEQNKNVNTISNIDFLSNSIFDETKEISIDQLIKDELDNEDIIDDSRYTSTFSDISEKKIISGRVIGMNDKEILIDIGFKSEGIINRDEFKENLLPEIGEKISVYLEKMEDESGKTVLSKEKAIFLQRWQELRDIFDTQEVITGKIIKRIKGGMVVDLDGVQAFLPGSQIDVRPVKDFDKYIDTDMKLKVVKFNEFRKNIVVSHKAILEESLAEQRTELFNKLKVGSIMEGRVKNITDFGVFIDLGGIDGLLHITDLSWGRVNHPSEIVNIDDNLSVKIIDFDSEKKRVSLGLKQLTPFPWENVQDRYPKGQKINGKIVSMTNYGAFVELEPGIEGLIHVSEMSWTRHVKNPSEVFSLGDEVDAVVLSIDIEEKKISLGSKQLDEDPWDKIEEKYLIGDKKKGKVINLTQFGAFVELDEGVDGLIHISDMSWTQIVKHPKEFLEKGQELNVQVLEVSRENRRISLGIKQLEPDPWPELIKEFEIGKDIDGKIIKILDKGIILELEHMIEGIIPYGKKPKRDRKILSSQHKVGDILKGTVSDVRPDDKKIIIYVEGLASEEGSKKDDIRAFLDNQDAPAGEKIQIPDDLVDN